MRQPRGVDGRYKGKRTVYVPVRMNDEDMARIAKLMNDGIGSNPSEVIRYALHNCSNDATLTGA